MAQTFPWPVTDDELAFNRAIEAVMEAYGPVGDIEQAWVREASGKLIIEAYNLGVRDEQFLARYALERLAPRLDG